MTQESYWARPARTNRRGMLGRSGALAAGLGASAFAGCGDDDDKAKKTATVAATGAAGASASAPAATPTKADVTKMTEKEFLASLPSMPPKDFDDKDIKTGGMLKRATVSTYGFDFHASTITSTAGDMVSAVYSKLMRFSNAAGKLKTAQDIVIEEDLAAKWEQPDSQTVVLTLQPNIKWQNLAPLNGRKFTADDVKYSFNRGATFSGSAYKAFYSAFSKIEDVGNNQVKMTLSAPDPSILIGLASPFALVMPPEIGENKDTAQTVAVGTGGFIMDKFTPNVEIQYKKNPDFFKKDAQGRQLPYIDGYVTTVIKDSATQLAVTEQGGVDLAHQSTTITADNAFEFAKRVQGKGLTIIVYRFLYNPFSICGHYQQPPWNDVRVRQAISNLIDRPTINEAFLKGLGVDGIQFPFSQVYDRPPTLDQLGPNYKYDPKRAKELLKAAGQENLSFNFHYAAGTPIVTNVVELFKQTAEQAGVKVNLVLAPDSAVQGQKQASKSWDGLLYATHGLNYPDFQAAYPILLPGSGLNFPDVNNPKYVQQFEKQRALQGDARKAVLKETYDTFLDDLPYVPFTQRPIFGVYKDRLKNWRDNAVATPAVGLGMGSFDSVWFSA